MALNLSSLRKGINNMGKIKLDEIGYWSEIKLDIIRKYAVAYSVIMNRQSFINSYHYIDGFAGAEVHISKNTGKFSPESPANALNVNPPFSKYHFIDLDGSKAELLRELGRDNPKVNELVPIVVGGLNGHSSSHSLRHL